MEGLDDWTGGRYDVRCDKAFGGVPLKVMHPGYVDDSNLAHEKLKDTVTLKLSASINSCRAG